ncbi:MAG: helix-turn-helix transcriptional regulator [Spirochaetaceae bacterium]|nr:helix-turn-helix transcriptional regulator [Spirochaetaceae bacterium]
MKSVLKKIHYVWNYQWPPFHTTSSFSPRGYTLHYMVEGEYRLTLNNGSETVRRGDMVYYAENEHHRYSGGKHRVIMYSVNFTSPDLPALARDKRIIPDSENFADAFKNLYLSFHQPKNTLETLSAFTLLSGILQSLYPRPSLASPRESGPCWEDVETMIKTERRYRIKSSELSTLYGISPSTLYRKCLRETGKSPVKKIQEIRLDEAEKLLRYSGMNISEIASYLGYPRIHEFSREFSKRTGYSPSFFKQLS